jgi:diaminohydroxyphosphoribosylaminopyrimidine deaminase/5-amino-6-(5-phosphoribosylamino)uracil reductase
MAEYIGTNRKKITDIEAMTLAVQEGKKGAGFVAPNPLVGAVILDREGRIISTGFHKKYGGDHAEIEALKGVSQDLLEGAHMFVTLEPCAHFGKTPPCADRLAQIPLASVTYGIGDPNPLVAGKGLAKLKAAGIKVLEFGEDCYNPQLIDPKKKTEREEQVTRVKHDLLDLPEVFLHNTIHQKPFVALKVATSMDGQMGLKTGESQWITNEKSRVHAHYLRGVFDSVLVGRRTFDLDNPSLNVRHSVFAEKTNRVVLLDPDGELLSRLPSSNIVKTHAPENIFYVISDTAQNLDFSTDTSGVLKKIQVIRCGGRFSSGFDLDFLLKELFSFGVTSVLLEGGSYVYQSFLTQNEVQRVYQFQAPILLGDQTGLSWTQGFGVKTMKDKIKLSRIQTQFFDTDILITGRIDS